MSKIVDFGYFELKEPKGELCQTFGLWVNCLVLIVGVIEKVNDALRRDSIYLQILLTCSRKLVFPPNLLLILTKKMLLTLKNAG